MAPASTGSASSRRLASTERAGPRLTPRVLARALLATLLLVAAPRVARGQKADSLVLRNGDHLTGEVKSLSRGLLKYSTDDLGTVSIEWDKVVRISTRTVLEVQLGTGQKFYGQLSFAPRGRVLLGVDTLRLSDIVTMVRIGKGVVARIDGYLDLGFSYQKASQTVQLTSGAKATYRGPKALSSLQYTTFLEEREDVPQTARFSAAFIEQVLLPGRWNTGVILGYDRNNELDLSGRGRVVGFGGRTLNLSNSRELQGTAGVVVATERYFSTDSSSNSLEGMVGASYRTYRYDAPKLNASVTSELFPSLTIAGRVRWQNDLRLSYELVKDFMLTLTLFDSFDSKPQSADASRNDFGTTLAASWTF